MENVRELNEWVNYRIESLEAFCDNKWKWLNSCGNDKDSALVEYHLNEIHDTERVLSELRWTQRHLNDILDGRDIVWRDDEDDTEEEREEIK